MRSLRGFVFSFAVSFTLVLLSISVLAETRPLDGAKVYQRDNTGRVLYHLPSYTVRNAVVYETDNTGRILQHRPSLVIKPVSNSRK